MNSLRKFKAIAAAAVLLTMGCSCNNEVSEFPETLNSEHISTLSRSNESVTYRLSGSRYFNMPTVQSSWKEIKEAMTGMSTWGPDMIVFNDGKVWTPVSLFSLSTGPSPFAMPWTAYLKATGKQENLYVAVDFEFDADNNTINLNGSQYGVLKFEPEEIVVSKKGFYTGGENGNGGQSMQWIYYKPAETVIINELTDRGFDSIFDAYAYILECARDQFGDTIDLNEVYAPDAIFDYNIIDLTRLEQYLENLKNQSN